MLILPLISSLLQHKHRQAKVQPEVKTISTGELIRDVQARAFPLEYIPCYVFQPESLFVCMSASARLFVSYSAQNSRVSKESNRRCGDLSKD